MTAFAVPITSGKNATPVGVVCCYSMIQSGSVPFVLRFVQQALHLLWSGLDKVEPHESVGQAMWQDVGPADLGEMAADVEMQHHFINKKRPHHSMSNYEHSSQQPDTEDQAAPLSAQFRNINFHRDEHEQTQHFHSTDVSQFRESDPIEIPEFYNFQQIQQQHEKPPEQRVSVQAIQAFQNHVKDAVRQVGEALPFAHSHVATTADGRKRAHVSHPNNVQLASINHHHQPAAPRQPRPPGPLAMPHAFPTRVVKKTSREHNPLALGKISPQLQSSPSQITKNLVGGMPSPPTQSQSYVPAPMPGQPTPPPPPYEQQNATQPIPPHASVQQTGAPSQLSQNLLSQGMLQSIASQQYEVPHDQGSTSVGQHQAGAVQYSTPISPSTVGMPGAPGTSVAPQPQASLQSDETYCLPISNAFPAPDTAKSAADPASTTAGGKVKLCRIQGCNDPAVIRRPYCARHSGNRLCEHEGCTKCAQGSTRFCIAHGGGRRCTFPGCDKGARDKFFCAAHGGGKRCKAEGCNKSAVGGSSLCTAHGGGRRCAVDGCDKSAQSSTKFCVKHGGGKKCAHEGCEKVARGRTHYCAAVSVARSFSGSLSWIED